MASYPGHQHASAFDQAARSRGHSNRRTALRPRRQQEATEVRPEQKMPTLLRVYIDGPHGMGKPPPRNCWWPWVRATISSTYPSR
nr:truncated thymidine kinase [Human alphaherpesvirus 1]